MDASPTSHTPVFIVEVDTALEAYVVKTSGEATLSVKLSWTAD